MATDPRRERLLASLHTRPVLPTTSSEFALSPTPSCSSSTAETSPLMQLRFARRPSILSKVGHQSEPRIQSPLAAAFDPHPVAQREPSMGRMDVETDVRMDSSGSSSENATPAPAAFRPPADAEPAGDSVVRRAKAKRARSPSTPPRNSFDSSELPARHHLRRPSHVIKAPRILSLVAESRPEESEVKSEAQFQRLLASFSELPTNSRASRPASDRGRYPEEVAPDESQREETPSDDGDEDVGNAWAIAVSKPVTPAQSVNGDEAPMLIPESPSGSVMDIDVYGSPSIAAAQATQWRYTPPPTANGAMRSNKRKFTDDRFDPYPTAKRRAVSPSMSYLRDGLHNPRTPGSSRGPIPISIPNSGMGMNTGMPSPTLSQAFAFAPGGMSRPVSVASSPTLRNMILASPILRPLSRYSRRGEEEEREIDGAGEAVGGLIIA